MITKDDAQRIFWNIDDLDSIWYLSTETKRIMYFEWWTQLEKHYGKHFPEKEYDRCQEIERYLGIN